MRRPPAPVLKRRSQRASRTRAVASAATALWQGAWGKMPMVGLQTFHRVERTFAQGLNAGRGSSEGVQKSQLNQVPAASARFDETACLAHVNHHVRSFVNVAREAGELSSH